MRRVLTPRAWGRVGESIFHLDGAVGHEIVFVHTGRLDPEPAAEGATLTESNGAVVPVVWRSSDDDAEALPLYPAGVMELFAQR
ncbi:hypothetical protein ACFC14_05260 [Microbacterium sp. NPDC055988]|uniref:hypothetical protein n=1 Tax=Microbacterium sp. NPDC055988 TaxID=3345671 RepID=UPI0035DB79C8